MTKIAYIKPTFPQEKRVGLLPIDLQWCCCEDERRFEKGYGEILNIADAEYGESGGYDRQSLFEWAEVIYCIKVPQVQDYSSFRENQCFVGWVHPTTELGRAFMLQCAAVKNLEVFDIINSVSMYYKQGQAKALTLPGEIIRHNSILAGYAATMHAIMLRGGISLKDRVAIFGSGNVALGVLKYLESRGIDPLLRRRSNAYLIPQEFRSYDIFINTVELPENSPPIVTDEILDKMKPGGWIIDAAADTGGVIASSRATTIANPIYQDHRGHTFYVIENSPSLLYRESSEVVSAAYARHFWSKPMGEWFEEVGNGVMRR